LKKKVADGCDVRLIYDDIGCMRTLPRKYELTLREEGIRAYRFARVNPRISSVHHNRDHRKICVIDGRVAYTGGVNIADEYANLIDRFGYWKDGGIRIVGDAVAGFTKMFLSLWDFTSGSVSDYGKFLRKSEEIVSGDGYYIPFGSGPAPIYKRPVGKNAFLNIINQSEKYVYITTPYLIIDYDLTQSLCNASMRGVDVRIITPAIADKKIIKIMTKSAYPYLMNAGVKIYEFTPGFMHEKAMICDDKYAIIGTINFDYRSLVHHFECAVWMYRTKSVLDAARSFDDALAVSELVTRKKSRLTLVEWLFRTGIKIFSPIL
jgi:cardiolipin synthase